jgi:NAD(P)H dehydrogenase (quinone)
MKLLILYYSLFGHVHRMAEAVAEGAREVPGTEVILRRVPETLPKGVLEKMGATKSPEKIYPHPGLHPAGPCGC